MWWCGVEGSGGGIDRGDGLQGHGRFGMNPRGWGVGQGQKKRLNLVADVDPG